jgi:hypothetical protein
MEGGIQRQDVFQDRRVAGAGSLEIDRPFDDQEIGVLDRHAADFQPGRLVGVPQRVLRAYGVQLARRAGRLPRQFSQRLAAELERERRLRREGRPAGACAKR